MHWKLCLHSIRITAQGIIVSVSCSRVPRHSQTSCSCSSLTSSIYTYVTGLVALPRAESVLQPIPKNVLGLVLMVVNSIVALVLIVLTILKFGVLRFTHCNF